MLGFFCDLSEGNGFSTSFIPTSSFRPKPRADRRQLGPVDARHGRVLLRVYKHFRGVVIPGFRLVVWNPITRHRVALPRPEGLGEEWKWRATVLCAAPAGSCDHLDCHRGHFIVVLIGNYPSGMFSCSMFSCVYSSQDDAWSKIIFSPHLGAYSLDLDNETSSAHVGNALYCMLEWGNKILKYDLGTREFSVMQPPVLFSWERYTERIQLTTMEDEQLGLAVLRDIGLVFMKHGKNGILSVDIRSAQVKVVDKRPCIYWIVPYINFCFCTPAAVECKKPTRKRKGNNVNKKYTAAARGK